MSLVQNFLTTNSWMWLKIKNIFSSTWFWISKLKTTMIYKPWDQIFLLKFPQQAFHRSLTLNGGFTDWDGEKYGERFPFAKTERSNIATYYFVLLKHCIITSLCKSVFYLCVLPHFYINLDWFVTCYLTLKKKSIFYVDNHL